MILTYQAHKYSPEGICFTLREYIPLIKVWTCGPVLWSVGWGVLRRYCRSCFYCITVINTNYALMCFAVIGPLSFHWHFPCLIQWHSLCKISNFKMIAQLNSDHWITFTEHNLGMGSANERRRYIVTSSRIGWAFRQNGPWWWGVYFVRWGVYFVRWACYEGFLLLLFQCYPGL